jgi:hypothetical protein
MPKKVSKAKPTPKLASNKTQPKTTKVREATDIVGIVYAVADAVTVLTYTVYELERVLKPLRKKHPRIPSAIAILKFIFAGYFEVELPATKLNYRQKV